MSLHPFMLGILITQRGLMTFPCCSLYLPSNYWEESCFVYKKLHFAKQCNRTELRDSPIASREGGLSTAMFGIGKKLAEEAAQQAGNAAQVAGKYRVLLSLLLCLGC